MKGVVRQIVWVMLAVAAGAAGSWLMQRWHQPETSAQATPDIMPSTPAVQVASPAQVPDFVYAAKVSRPAVVHIRVLEEYVRYRRVPATPWFGDFFWEPQRYQAQRYGSGVIVSSNGYIVTNKHVVGDGKGRIQVTLFDKRVFEARLVGMDPETDLAVLKIDAEGLPFLKYGNSDAVQVGEWVLAVGNPFNLTSTVTAGIVSAKGRDMNIIPGQFSLRSFIQTDAAVNPGNSGGALVNLKGELIGINTAIATPTGVYAGYAFAVPVNIVKKVVHDLIKYGKVRRGYLGISFRNMSNEEARRLGLPHPQGAYVVDVVPESPADEAGIQKGDVILAINDVPVESTAQLQELIAQHSPGDEVTVRLFREGKTIEKKVQLASRDEAFHSRDEARRLIRSTLGIEVEPLDPTTAEQLGVEGGLQVKRVHPNGLIARYTGIKPGFVILRVNGRPIRSETDLYDALNAARGSITIEGIYPGSSRIYYYGFSW